MSKVKHILSIDYPLSFVKISALFFITLYAWHQSHFQFQEYWGEPYKSLSYYFFTMLVLIFTVYSLLNKYPRENVYFVGSYILIVLLYGSLQYILYDVNILTHLKSIALLICSLLIIKSKENLMIFIRINFTLGMILIILNMVTLFHWLDIFNLSYEQISRVGGETIMPQLDPYSFGIFGRTESYIGVGDIIPRLQGFSSEPLHWGYFVLMTFSMGMLLYAKTSDGKFKYLLSSSLIVVLIYSYFIKSTTIYISFIYIAACFVIMLIVFNINRIRKYKKISMFFFIILVPGFIIPFTLVLMSNVEQIFQTESVFNEGGNWKGKIDFLYLSSNLFMQFLPSGSSYIPITHNLILDTYIKFGYLLIIPLLFALFEFINISISYNKYSNLAVITFLVTATLAAPYTIFLPSGVLWAAVIFGVTYHLNWSEIKINE
jgi:hypothetical protein